MKTKEQQFSWEIISPDEVLASIQSCGKATTKKRMGAYERTIIGTGAATDFKKTNLEIQEGTAEVLTLPVPSAGVSFFHITLKPHAHLTLYFFDERVAPHSSLTILKIRLEEGAELISYSGIFADSSSFFIQDTELVGRGSTLTQKTLFFGRGRHNVEMFSSTKLRGQDTTALIESKGILTEQAQATFDGSIEIEQTARGADAHLDEHTLLLSPEARINAIPGLTIGTNDIKASHSAGVTQVDEEQLFFAAARGIEEKEATLLIVDGFMAAPVSGTPFEKIVRKLVRKKLMIK